MFLTPVPELDGLLFVLLALFVAHIAIEKKRGHWMLIDPLNAFWGGVLACYLLQPFTYYHELHSVYSEEVLVKTEAAICWGVLWVLVGYHAPWGVKVGNKLPNMPAKLQPGLLNGAGWTMVGLGLLGYVFLVATAGSFEAWISEGRGGTNWGAISGYTALLEYFLPAGIAILLFRVELIPASTVFRGTVWALAALQWLWLVYLGSRSRTIIFLGTIAAAIYLPRRKNPSWILVIVTAVFLGLLTSFQAHYRGNFHNLSFNFDEMDSREVWKKILPPALGGERKAHSRGLGDLEYNCVAAVVKYVPESTPYNYGFTLLELGTRIIPRAWWPEKRYPLFEAQMPVMEYGNLSRKWYVTPNTRFLIGPSFTYIGYWFHAGGWIGLVLAGLYTGVFFRVIRNYLDRDLQNHGNVIFYVMMFPVGFQEMASNPFYWVFTLALVVVPMVVLMFMARDKRPTVPVPALAHPSFGGT